MVEEDLSTYIKQVAINVADESDVYQETVTNEDGVDTIVSVDPEDGISFSKPLDLARIINMYVTGTNTSVELIYDAEKAQRVLQSNLSTPTQEFPTALVMGNYIQVFPEAVEAVTMVYYRQPRGVNFNTGLPEQTFPQFVPLQTPGLENLLIVDPDNSKNFDLPEHYINELVSEIVKMIGVRLRDTTLTSYGLQQTQAE
jgi:hypothetical protein